MKLVKGLLGHVLFGAASYVGYCIAEEAIRTARNPVKRAAFKRKINEIKNVIFKKEEES